MNMLEYIKDELAKQGKTLDDIGCIEVGDTTMTREQFIEYASNATYIVKPKRPHLVRVK